MKASEMPKVIKQLLVMQPNVYSIKVSESLKKLSPEVKDLQNKNWSDGKSIETKLLSLSFTFKIQTKKAQ